MPYKKVFFTLISLLLSCLQHQLKAQVTHKIYWSYSQQDTVNPQSASKLNYTFLDKDYKSPALHNSGTYWFKIILDHVNPKTDLVLQITNPHLDSVYFYQMGSNGTVINQQVSGNNFKKTDSTYLRYTKFKFKATGKELYLKTNFKKNILFPVSITSAVKFNKAEQINFFRMGLYYGFVLMVLSVNTFFYFTFKDSKFIHYCVFLFLIALTFAYADGLYVFISRNSNWLNHSELAVHLLVVSAGAVFATSFLEIDRVYPKIKWFGVGLGLIMLATYSTHLLIGGTYLFYAGHVAGLLLLSLYWLAGVWRFNKDVFARFFVIAYGFLLILAYDFFLIRELGLKFLNMNHNQLKLASIAEMIVLSLTITYRVRVLQKENRYYRKEINRYIKEAIAYSRKTGATDQETLTKVQERYELTARELEVLEKIMKGLNNTEIATELFLSPNTIKYHIRNIYNKMEINSREEVISLLKES